MALQVLAIKLPVNQTALDAMIKQIKESLLNVTDIEGIVNQTSQHIGKAKDLLGRAKDAKYVAVPIIHQACSINKGKKQSIRTVIISN